MADLSGASLTELQRWFQAAITGGEAVTTEVATVITASARQHPVERLAVYRRGYRLRLLECLRGSFPALCHLLGQDLFDGFADDYLDACPSQSYTLFQLGERFADHLQCTRPDRDRPPAEQETWVDLLVDLACFERAFAEVYHGPGTETGPIVRAADLPADTDPGWLELTLRPAPCLRVVTTRYPVHGYAAAVARGGAPPLPRAQPAVLAVHRRAYTVLVTELTPPADGLLRALIDGETVTGAATTAGIPPATAPSWIRRWVEAGLFTAWAPRSALGHSPAPTPTPDLAAQQSQPSRV
ncbi:MAG: HvfC/BufC family peptide modification chaperone [Pseudonocardiaceae bacterium]